YATEAYCTHAMADLGDGILEGDIVECTLHFGAFHVPSGKAVREPCCTDLKTFRTEVKDGQVYVDLSAPATTGSEDRSAPAVAPALAPMRRLSLLGSRGGPISTG